MRSKPLLAAASPRRGRRVARSALAAALVGTALLAGVLPAATAQDDSGAMSGGAMSGDAPDPPVVHDPAYLRDRVLPVLLRQCIGCHDAEEPENKSRHRLVDAGADGKVSDDAARRNYEMLRGFLRPDAPERSLLLLKLLPAARGGADHDGGKAAEGGDFPSELVDAKGPLVSWIFGATATDAPPLALWAPVARTVASGEEVRLDGTLSYDPDGKPVTVRWEVYDAPQGARAKVEDPSAKTTRIVPDREGPWTLRLRVSDGKLRGWPALVRFAVTRRAEVGPPGGTGTAPGAPTAVADSITRRATRRLFLDLRGRTPTEEELAALVPLPWEQRVDRLLDGDATWQDWLDEEAFYFLLIDQFRPVSDRIVALPAGLREGRQSFRDAHQALALSAEFNARNPGNDTYCTVVLEQFLGIEVQKAPKVLETAKRAYDGKLERLFNVQVNSQSDVVRATLDQKGYVDLFVRRMARRYLRQELPPAEHDAAVAMLTADPLRFRAVLREWLLSPRYADPDRPPCAKTDHQFIRSLFVDLLGRPPAYEEFRNMRNALQALADPTPLRGVLAKVLLDSSAAVAPTPPDSPAAAPRPGATTDRPGRDERWTPAVTELFRRLLGRDPSARELDAFSAVLAEDGATWRTAALAIVTSGQYQYY